MRAQAPAKEQELQRMKVDNAVVKACGRFAKTAKFSLSTEVEFLPEEMNPSAASSTRQL